VPAAAATPEIVSGSARHLVPRLLILAVLILATLVLAAAVALALAPVFPYLLPQPRLAPETRSCVPGLRELTRSVRLRPRSR